jgi:hypothetical protein
MIWNVPKIWQNGEVWILGGGPSVFKQFEVPKEVTQKVLAGASPSLYSPYLSFLHDKHVIGINIAYRIGDWIDVIFFGDAGFFTQYKLELANFNGLKVSCSDSIANQDWIKHTPHHPKYYYGISQTIGYVC